MNDQLFLELPLAPQLEDSSLSQEVSWLHWDPAAGKVRERGRLAADKLAELETQFGNMACYAIVPGEVVSWHQVTLPKGGRVGLGALPFQMEERLCSDLESVHLAHEDIHANKPTHVLVVDHTQMVFWSDLLKQSGLRVKSLLPDYGAIPENVLILDEYRAAMHLNAAAGAVETVNFPVWWQLAGGVDEPRLYCVNALSGNDILPVQPHAMVEQRLEAVAASWQPWLPSLLCGSYTIRDEQSALAQQLRAPILLLLTLLLVHWSNLGLAIWDNQRQVELLDVAIDKVYTDTFPGSRVVNARSQMRSQLNAIESGGAADSRFLPMLEKIANATRGKGELVLQQMSFSSSPPQIKLSVKASGYEQVDQWVAALKAQGLEVERGAFGAAGQESNAITGQLSVVEASR